MRTLRSIIFATAIFFGLIAGPHADDLRLFPTALLQMTNNWVARQQFSGGFYTAGGTLALFGFNNYGAPGTAAGEKIAMFNGITATSDYSLGVNGSELWINAGSGVVDFYTAGTKTGGVGVGGFIFPKLSAAPSSAPGAGITTVFAVAGTNSGTCKLQAMAGTSTTPVTILDNIGAGC